MGETQQSKRTSVREISVGVHMGGVMFVFVIVLFFGLSGLCVWLCKKC
jgi:hypothetical protein